MKWIANLVFSAVLTCFACLARAQLSGPNLRDTLDWLADKTTYEYRVHDAQLGKVCDVSQTPEDFNGCEIRWVETIVCQPDRDSPWGPAKEGSYKRFEQIAHKLDLRRLKLEKLQAMPHWRGQESTVAWMVLATGNWAESRDIVQRAIPAFRNAAELCGAKLEPF